ncbi:PREDICTED: uncharacterized protein LOC109235244 [Nicotiana attenuata]|uniref:uncharacterized protein LOC109235244 n=1 Tax=Nicotiana attenuata TaxID=49451 RepID=UPI0009059FA0|nr:PREDICTED: uncharacterized protein LOC109235244 [Nicotiana attenuata]
MGYNSNLNTNGTVPCTPSTVEKTKEEGKQMETQAQTWANVVVGNKLAMKGMNLQFIAPIVQNGEKMVKIEGEDVEQETAKWKNAIVIYVIGDSPSIGAMDRFVHSLGKYSKKPQIYYHNEDYFIIRFISSEERDRILYSGPHTINNRPIIMKAWLEEFNLHDEVLKTIPLWVKLPNLPVNWWSMTALSKIGSALGNPIYVDECTTDAVRVSYARLLVEMDITKPLPRQIKLQDPKGREMMQMVEYDWEPKYCNKCLKIGHECTENRKPIQQKKKNKGRMAWVRVDKEEYNETKENDQKIESSEQPRIEAEQGKDGVQSKDAWWITVVGKSAARTGTAKQKEVHSIDEANTFQSLMYDHRNKIAGTSQISSQGDQGSVILGGFEASPPAETVSGRRLKAEGSGDGQGTRKETFVSRVLGKITCSQEVKEFVRINNKAIIAIVEHRVKELKAIAIIRKIAPRQEWVSNAKTGNKGRIWIMWDPRIYIFDPKEMDEQFIHGQVRVKSRPVNFGFTAVYGLHTIKDRKPLWDKLRQINSIQQGPWLVMGDFNAVLHITDRQHGSEVQDMEMKDFKEYMMDTGMNELPSVGRDYTWTNNHTYSRIDKGLVNTEWMMIMPSMKIQVLKPLISDHSPLKLMITQGHTKKCRPFRFLNCIADHPQFIQLVQSAWKEEKETRKMQRVWQKLKRTEELIKELNTQHYKGLDGKIKEARIELQTIQEDMGNRRHDTVLIEKERILKQELEK